MVVFGDHQFCAGKSLDVLRMPSPHMHSQIEFNFVLEGGMTYWFDGRELSVEAGRLALFWGMIPHQVTGTSGKTRFVCLYVPMSVFLGLPTLSRLREAIFKGAVIEPVYARPYDRDMFLGWHSDLLSGDTQLEQIVRDELTARVRRLDREGWHDLREEAQIAIGNGGHDGERIYHVERMARFIGEHGIENISVADVSASCGLHANYAMTLYKRSLGITIKQAIIRHRLDTARSLLIATESPVASIAFDCGFNSLSSFYAAFAQRFATSPATFRRTFAERA